LTTAAVEHGHGHGGDAHGHGHGAATRSSIKRRATCVCWDSCSPVSDVVLFSAFVFAYLYLRGTIDEWPPILNGHQLPRLDLPFAEFNSIVLFGSGVTMHHALENWKHGKKGLFDVFMGATIVLGIMFLLGQAYEYSHAQIGGWSGSIFGASFFTLTGMHRFPRLLRRVLPGDPVVADEEGATTTLATTSA